MVSSLSFIRRDRRPQRLSDTVSLHHNYPEMPARQRECSEHPPSGMLSPKATVQSNPLLAGALTSAESLDRTIPLLLERRQKRHNYLQSSHQAQQGLRDGCWGPHIHSISTSQTAQLWPVTIFSPRGKTTWSFPTLQPNKLRPKCNTVSKLSKCTNDFLAPRPICKHDRRLLWANKASNQLLTCSNRQL